MMLDPVAPWWVLVVVGLALLAVCGSCLVRRPGQRTAWTRRLVMVVALIGLAAQPSLGTSAARVQRSNLDVLIAVDNSPSVNATDYDGSHPRLAGVRADVQALAASLDGARFSLVTFGSAATQVLPFTTDASALDSALSITRPEYDGSSAGSTLDRPVTLLRSILDRDAKSAPTRQRVLVLTSDGEQTVDHPPGSFASLRRYLSGGAVLGYGTSKGGFMIAYDPNDPNAKTRYIDGPDGARGVSKLNETNLRRAAGQLGVPYHHRTSSGGVADDLSLPAARAGAGEDTTRVGRPLYWIPAIVLGALALWEAWALAASGGLGRRA